MKKMLLGCAFVVATTVSMRADAALDLAKYEIAFDEQFDSLSVSPWGPGTRWIAHTPWNGDFGDAKFVNPREGFPFTTKDGILRIEARRNESGKWESGLLASVDRAGNGFSQKYGYFEVRAKFPAGKGLWPAFWLIGIDRSTHTSEIDVVEHYGHAPERYTASVHVWDRKEPKKSSTVHKRVSVKAGSLYEDFHTYGVLIDEQWTRFFFDRQEVWRNPTPEQHRQPMYVLVNLGLGAGWPLDEAPHSAEMLVDYVRVWRAKP
ncbi:endo-1,3-1,4-beta-glycanase ExsH [Variibacter gotjawalensis]|uniref:Endo-1,3-1,4-beta-glycanase ExsH n=1 Tax=Variibacter gotjawalensis TaxID=1333996 RepID=A0A0S3Q031_9BRAD|nr:glycoside hydrolase family 16 protein [Variibacter gotjawalensis]NIK47326.1 beta-glucanase (GH16 family) [Variibacter gotjawalensis]RZS49224.1 glycosyl hydrolase family 16 [Variibacter gotjawalensis]BAT61486.1 endo-1,3-1,4-beta-glycanase ExsH [Variibacter gotjawalensis]